MEQCCFYDWRPHQSPIAINFVNCSVFCRNHSNQALPFFFSEGKSSLSIIMRRQNNFHNQFPLIIGTIRMGLSGMLWNLHSFFFGQMMNMGKAYWYQRHEIILIHKKICSFAKPLSLYELKGFFVFYPVCPTSTRNLLHKFEWSKYFFFLAVYTSIYIFSSLGLYLGIWGVSTTHPPSAKRYLLDHWEGQHH